MTYWWDRTLCHDRSEVQVSNHKGRRWTWWKNMRGMHNMQDRMTLELSPENMKHPRRRKVHCPSRQPQWWFDWMTCLHSTVCDQMLLGAGNSLVLGLGDFSFQERHRCNFHEALDVFQHDMLVHFFNLKWHDHEAATFLTMPSFSSLMRLRLHFGRPSWGCMFKAGGGLATLSDGRHNWGCIIWV